MTTDRLRLAKRRTMHRVRIGFFGLPWVSSLVECRICSHRQMSVIRSDSPHVEVFVHDVQCGNCLAMTSDTVGVEAIE